MESFREQVSLPPNWKELLKNPKCNPRMVKFLNLKGQLPLLTIMEVLDQELDMLEAMCKEYGTDFSKNTQEIQQLVKAYILFKRGDLHGASLVISKLDYGDLCVEFHWDLYIILHLMMGKTHEEAFYYATQYVTFRMYIYSEDPTFEEWLSPRLPLPRKTRFDDAAEEELWSSSPNTTIHESVEAEFKRWVESDL